MPKTIWKFPLWENSPDDYVEVEMPQGAVIIDAAFQDQTDERSLCLWALVDPSAPKVTRRFRTAGTGHPVHDDPIYPNITPIGSALLHGGQLVFHILEIS